MKAYEVLLSALVLGLGAAVSSYAQASTGTIYGTVSDQNEALIPDATVSIRNTNTGWSRSMVTSAEGRYQFVNVPPGAYDVTVGAATFAGYVRHGISLDTNQNALIDVELKPGTQEETITVNENASFVNATTAEVDTHLDHDRLANLPVAPDGSVYNALTLAPGVTQVGNTQMVTNLAVNFTSNGSRARSNSFTLDGQDINDPNLSGPQIPLNNPDAIGEVQMVTNQFLAEYGRNSGSVANFVTKSGTNKYHGSGLLFYNGEALNSCSNLDKAAGFCSPTAPNTIWANAPPTKEFRYGFTLGGPFAIAWPRREGTPAVRRSANTFFFTDFLKWTSRGLGSGSTINGAPTSAGRDTLRQYLGDLPQVQALLKFVPPGTANPNKDPVMAGGHAIEVGTLTGSVPATFNASQGAIRVDHAFGSRNLIYGRYRGSGSTEQGEQATPPGLSTLAKVDTNAATFVWNSQLTNRLLNNAQFAWTRLDARYTAQDPSATSIPSIEISELGMNGAGHYPGRTAFGQAVNLPQTRKTDLYQVIEEVSLLRGRHSLKFGVDIRRRNVSSFFIANTRGRLFYSSLDGFVSDRALVAAISLPLQGGQLIANYGWNEPYGFAQDEWRIRPTMTLTLGLRYEYPGDSFGSLKAVNRRIVAANGNDPAFLFSPQPSPDTNNLMPRIGFAWSPETENSGIVGWITGGNKAVIRGGYARSYDPSYIVMNATTFNSFPFLVFQGVPPPLPGFVTVQSLRGTSAVIPDSAAAMMLTRTAVAADFRMPHSDQVSMDYQRVLSTNIVVRVGYVGSWGSSLYQTVDGNPRLPCAYGSGLPGTNTCNNVGVDPFTGAAVPTVLAPRVDPTRGTIQLRANPASSSYNGFQASFEKRFSHGVAANVYYTWSTFIDTTSDIFGGSEGDSGISVDSFNLSANRGRSAYDYPQRLSANAVYQLPFAQSQRGVAGRLFGGWQVASVITLRSGVPFSVLNGSDPAGALVGIDAVVGETIRPNIYTDLKVSRTPIRELYATDQKLRKQALATAAANFKALPPGPCVPGFVPGAALNNLLFARAKARITCTAGERGYTVDFNGVEPGQRFGNAGRNILRSEQLELVDFSIAKNSRLSERFTLQLRADVFNAFNHRNFGTPDSQVNSANFLNQWARDGGNRQIVLGMRINF